MCFFVVPEVFHIDHRMFENPLVLRNERFLLGEKKKKQEGRMGRGGGENKKECSVKEKKKSVLSAPIFFMHPEFLSVDLRNVAVGIVFLLFCQLSWALLLLRFKLRGFCF